MSRFDDIRDLVRSRARNRDGLLCQQELQRELAKRPVDALWTMIAERLRELAPCLVLDVERQDFVEGVLGGQYMPIPTTDSEVPGGAAFENALVDLMIGRDPAAHYARLAPTPQARGSLQLLAEAIFESIGAEMIRAWGQAYPDRWRADHEAGLRLIDAINRASDEGRSAEEIDEVERAHRPAEDPMRGWYDDPLVIAAERAAWDDVLERLARIDAAVE